MSIVADDTATDTGISDGDAVAQLMAAMSPPKKPAANTPDADEGDEDDDGQEDQHGASDEDDDQDDDGNDDDDQGDDDGDDEGDEGDEGEEAPEAAAAAAAPLNDDAEVVVVVDGVETKHTLGSLKRLAGQEASLTRKSQEADVVGSRAAIVLQGALESVLEDLKPYEGVDWLVEQQNMEPEEFKWHREQFTRLQGRYQKLVGNAQTFGETMTAKQKAATTERAQKALKVLSDPKDGIPGWNDQVYNDIMAYGISQGLDPNDVAQIADAPVIKLIHQAMMFSKGQKTVAAKVAKVNDTPAKVRKGSGRETIAPEGGKSQRTLERKLASGRASDDDAIALLTGRWGVKGR